MRAAILTAFGAVGVTRIDRNDNTARLDIDTAHLNLDRVEAFDIRTDAGPVSVRLWLTGDILYEVDFATFEPAAAFVRAIR